MEQSTLMEYIAPHASLACKQEVRAYLQEDFTRMFQVIMLMQRRAKAELMEDYLSGLDNSVDILYSMAPPTVSRVSEDSGLHIHRGNPLDKTIETGWSSEESFDQELARKMQQADGNDTHKLVSLVLNYINQKIEDL